MKAQLTFWRITFILTFLTVTLLLIGALQGSGLMLTSERRTQRLAAWEARMLAHELELDRLMVEVNRLKNELRYLRGKPAVPPISPKEAIRRRQGLRIGKKGK